MLMSPRTPRKSTSRKNTLTGQQLVVHPWESFEEKVFSQFEDRRHRYFLGSALRMKPIASYTNGSIIGEKAFLSEEGLALTTVVLYEKCFFLTLTRKDYDLVFAEEMLRLKDKISFLQRVFPAAPKSQIAKVSYSFEKVTVRNEEFIYKEGDEAKSVFVVLKGEVQVGISDFEYF